ncbi:MAG TPA: RNA polymerase sigma factor [Deltaproteobacteria bacterium]|nr:RNA polymerase sigma factor [Deltaproteobacteria bacterium]
MTFDALLAAHAPQVLRAAIGWLGDEQEAAECAQEAMLKAYRARARYDATRPFYPWLHRIVRNTCFDAISRRKHRALPGLEEHQVASEGPTVLDALAQEESIATVRRAMAGLGEPHREILVLRHFQDLSYAEISQLLGIPEGTVMSRLYRARRALVRALQEEP